MLSNDNVLESIPSFYLLKQPNLHFIYTAAWQKMLRSVSKLFFEVNLKLLPQAFTKRPSTFHTHIYSFCLKYIREQWHINWSTTDIASSFLLARNMRMVY